jgi:ribulose-phosphate 3-epimerase
VKRRPEISASILNADFAALGAEVDRAARGGVDSIHLDVMDGHFVPNISMGPVVVQALRPHSVLPFHTHLMISQPLRYIEEFANAGSDIIVFHVEADDPPERVVEAIHATGRAAGIAINPETPLEAILPYLDLVDMVLVMTVHPGFGGQSFIREVLPKLRALREEIDRRAAELPIAIDGGVNLETIGDAFGDGGDVLVVGTGLYRTPGDLEPMVLQLRAAAAAGGEAVSATIGAEPNPSD